MKKHMYKKFEMVPGLHLAKAITFIESTVQMINSKLGNSLLKRLLPYTGNSIRIGITGVPGAGKSTFIEAFGKMLGDEGYKSGGSCN